MERLTKETPSNNREALFNYAYAKEQEVWLRYAGGEEDIRLVEYLSQVAKEKGCECSPEDILNGDACRECDCEVEVLNTVAIQAAELRGRLMAIEDILGEEYDLDHIRKIMEADGLKDLKELLERYKGVWSAICDENNVPQVSWGRASELCRADKEDRAVIVPCKVGQRVFSLLDNAKRVSECEVKQIIIGERLKTLVFEPIGERGREYGASFWCFGKTVFLTREEAEEALKGGGADA